MVMAFVHLGYITQIRSGHPAKRSNAIAMRAGGLSSDLISVF